MPKPEGPTGRKRRALVRTQKAKKVRPGAPLLETRARSILSTMVTEVTAEPTDLQLPEAPAAQPAVAAEPVEMAAASIDDLPAADLAEIVSEGASLELDGARHEAKDLASLAKKVKDDAHLKINNSGTFTADELARIARSASGQVIFA